MFFDRKNEYSIFKPVYLQLHYSFVCCRKLQHDGEDYFISQRWQGPLRIQWSNEEIVLSPLLNSILG